jgi:molybdate transport system substrate-binding protein
MKRGFVAAVVVPLLLTGCGSATSATEGSSTASGSALSGQLTVLAAASLTGGFDELARLFQAQHPDVVVKPSYAGSSALARQIVEGAPADVFAAANPQTMKTVTDAGLAVEEPAIFASNTLQIAVPVGNPAGVTGLADLAKPELKVALCEPQVPCGTAAQAVLTAAGLTVKPDTLEQDVKAVTTKVQLGEADAGLVYRTDVLATSGAVDGIDFPEAEDAVNDYPIVVLQDAPNQAAAGAFVEFVRSPQGAAVLSEAGFDVP